MNASAHIDYPAPVPPATPPTDGLFGYADDTVFDLPEGESEPRSQENPCTAPSAHNSPGGGTTAEAENDLSEVQPGANVVELRDYQELAVKAVLHQFNQKVTSTLVVSATGTGKTVCMADLSRRFNLWGHGVLCIVHRDELIGQITRSMSRVGIHALREKASSRALPGFGFLSKTVVASVQTLRGDRLAAWPRDAFRLIITDECHRAVADSYTNVYGHFQNYRHVGFTATADRLDGKNLGNVYETLAFEYNLRDAIRDTWLVPIEAVTLRTDPVIDLRDLRITAGDFNLGDLDRKIQDNIGTLVNAVADTSALEDRRTIAFAPSVGGAQALALALNDVGISAEWVAGSSPDRAEVFRRHQAGEFQVLCSCELVVEGYDDEQVSCILMCRPTRSRRILSQAVGRGTRRYPHYLPPQHPDSLKKNCRVVDFAFVTEKHSLVCSVDLYDNSDTADEVVERARDLIQSGQERDLDAALEQAQLEFDEARRVRIQRRAVRVQATRFDAVTACDLFNIPQHKEAYSWGDVEPATDRQIAALQKWGIGADANMSKAVASKLLKKVLARKDHGWSLPYTIKGLIERGIDPDTAVKMREREGRAFNDAHPLGPTEKQAGLLKRRGIPESEIAGMTRKQASQRIDALLGKTGGG